MRIFSFFLIPVLLMGWMGTIQRNAQAYALNGTWIPVSQVMAGKELPPAAFENYKLTMADTIYTYGRPDIDQGVVIYNNGKMDIYGWRGVNTGKHYTAIYKLEDSQLTICYNLGGDSYPESFETKLKPKFFLTQYKKE